MAIIVIQAVRGTPTGVALGLVIGISQAAILIAARAGFPLRWMGQILIGSLYLFSIGVVIASGANATTAVLVASLLPMIATLVAGPKQAVGWTLATLAGVGAAACYASTTNEFIFSGAILASDQARFPVLASSFLPPPWRSTAPEAWQFKKL
jgi:hypothetical protein